MKDCKLCPLHLTAKAICMDGPLKTEYPKLLIYVDNPSMEEDKKRKAGSSDVIQMVLWLLDRMSVSTKDVSIQFTLKCYKSKKQLKKKDERLEAIKACSVHSIGEFSQLSPRTIICMGPISCEAFFNGAQAKTKAGWKWQSPATKIVERVWVTNSPASAVPPASPSESVELYRVLFKAAEEAGLNPCHNPNCKPYPFDV
jgi:uracil-DNA glycosylase